VHSLLTTLLKAHPLHYSYDDLVGQAASRVEEVFKEGGKRVVVLSGPGSSRLKVAKKVAEKVPGSEVVSYGLSGLEGLQGEGAPSS